MPIFFRLRRATFSLVIPLLLVTSMFATDWTAPEQELAQKIVAVTGPGAIFLQLTNRSSLRAAGAAEIERGLRARMTDLGVAFVASNQAAATVQVWLSENLRSSVWIAQIQQGTNEPTAVMVSATRAQTEAAQLPAPALTIRHTLLWTQPQRILDAAVLDGNPAHLLLLDESGVTILRPQSGQWKPEQVLVISHDKPWPRDLRGRLVPAKDHLFDAYLPEMFCQSSATAPLALNCRPSDDPWPLAPGQPTRAFFSPARNFFTGVLTPAIAKQTPAFYSAAALPRPNYALWLLTGVDGRVHLLDGINDQMAVNANWGSDIAAVRSGCGSGTQVLATSNTIGSHDTVQAFEVADRDPIAASAAVDFTGEITALWTDASGTSVVAINRDAQTGAYAAYRLSIACGQ